MSNGIDIAKHIARSYPDNRNAEQIKLLIPRDVPLQALPHIVRDAVNLEGGSALCAKKVDDELANRVLIAELHAKRPAAQAVP